MSNSLQLHDCSRNPGNNAGVGYHFLLKGDLPDSGIEPASLESPALADGFFTTVPPGKPVGSNLVYY